MKRSRDETVDIALAIAVIGLWLFTVVYLFAHVVRWVVS